MADSLTDVLQLRLKYRETMTLRRQNVFSGMFLALLSLHLAHAVRIGWQATCGACYSQYPQLPATAPEAYRLAMPWTVHWIGQALRLHDATSVDAGLECVLFFCAMFLFKLLVEERSDGPQRWANTCLFLALIQVPIASVLYQQRPETSMTSLFVALAMLCIERASGRYGLLLVLAAGVQALGRADVPMVFGVALIIVGLVWRERRRFNLLCGLAVATVSGSIQAIIEFVARPNLPYSTGSPIMLLANLRQDHLVRCLLALLPIFLALFLLPRRARVTDSVVLIAALIYLPIWFTVGVIAEVRIYVPFMFGLCAVAASMIGSRKASGPEAHILGAA